MSSDLYTIADGEIDFRRIEPELPIRAGEIMVSVIRGLFALSGGEVLLENKKPRSDDQDSRKKFEGERRSN